MELPRHAKALLNVHVSTGLAWSALPQQIRMALNAVAVADPCAVIAGPAVLSIFFGGTRGPAAEVVEIDCLTDEDPDVIVRLLRVYAPSLRWLINDVAPPVLNEPFPT